VAPIWYTGHVSPQPRWDDHWFDSIPFDPYEVLGVPRDVSTEELDRRFRDQARRHHPDAGNGSGDRMSQLNWAHDLISDPSQRAAYDRIRDQRRSRPGAASGASTARRTGPQAGSSPPEGAHHGTSATKPPQRRRQPSALGCAFAIVLAALASCVIPTLVVSVYRTAQRPTEPDDYVLDDGALSCETSERQLVLGQPTHWLIASGALTNRTERSTGFNVKVTFRSAAPDEPDGTRALIDVVAVVGPLEPGESGTFEARALTAGRVPGLTCTVTDVWYENG
jgi:hypothetical protein